MTKTKRGFTLVELMIVVAILAVLGAIAIPLYRGHVETSRQAEAKANLQQIRLLQEQYFSDKGKYAPIDGTALNYDTSSQTIANVFKAFTPGPPEALNYDYVISGGGAAFVANATYRAIPTKFFTIDQDNNRRDQDGKAW